MAIEKFGGAAKKLGRWPGLLQNAQEAFDGK
jgi:hypothetical protein